MDAKAYDEWYESSFGRWVGKKELDLIVRQLQPKPHETLLDLGCGTGYFTRELLPFVKSAVGVDLDLERINYARTTTNEIEFIHADASDLAFDDNSFDLVVAITSLGFMSDQQKALSEMVRVAKRKVVLAVLNRDSTLWEIEGKTGGSGGYIGAYWHTANELRQMLKGTKNLELRSAIFSVKDSLWAKTVEELIPNRVLTGAFLVASFDL